MLYHWLLWQVGASGDWPGDELFWNGSIAGFELAATDRIDFNYLITS